jgi:polyisoprenoid-binding protein YceI
MAVSIEGYRAGTWTIDPAHSEVNFMVRYMGMSKVRGSFSDFSGQIVTAEDPQDSSVTATVDVASVSTGQAKRDEHLRTSDFFAIEEHPQMSFTSTAVRPISETEAELEGDLTIRGVTQRVTFSVEFGGISEDPWGNTRTGATASTTINRDDFGLDWNAPLEKSGGVLVSSKVVIDVEVSATLNA